MFRRFLNPNILFRQINNQKNPLLWQEAFVPTSTLPANQRSAKQRAGHI
jgi:hypothetical protein